MWPSTAYWYKKKEVCGLGVGVVSYFVSDMGWDPLHDVW